MCHWCCGLSNAAARGARREGCGRRRASCHARPAAERPSAPASHPPAVSFLREGARETYPLRADDIR